MFYSPFSQPTEYISPDGKGIYLKPASEAVPDGWGEPRIDDDGKPITPGTEGGPFPNVLINKQKGIYKASASKYRQLAGNITWWGDWYNPAQMAKGRYVLSYKGPKLRYFREEGFSYGSENSHNEIYYLGSYATVAPGPVLGAGMKSISYYDASTQTTKQAVFIFAVCYKGGEDRFYRKRWGYRVIPPPTMTDDIRQQEMALYDQYENPTGWEQIGTFPKQEDAFAPETPWFFNKSCTAAATIRRKVQQFHNGESDQVEDAFDRYTAAITADGAVVTNLGNNLPYEYEEKINKESPAYSQAADHMGFPHEWQEDHVTVDIKISGSQYVMCDYIEDVLWWGKVKYDIVRTQAGYYTEGIDPPVYMEEVNGQPQNISNDGMRLGPRYLDFYEYNYTPPEPYVPQEADHEFTLWVGVSEQINLYYGPEGAEETHAIELHKYRTGTSDEWAGNPWQENNQWLFFYEFYTRHFRGMMDIRFLAFFSQDLQKYGLWQNRPSPIANRTLRYKDFLFYEYNIAGQEYGVVKKTNDASITFGWPLETIDALAETISQTLTRTTYEGRWPDDNYDGDVQEPGNKTFYAQDASGDLASNWPTIPDLFYGPSNTCKGNGVTTDRTELGFSIEVPDVEQEGAFVLISDMKPAGNPKTVVGFGEKYYPVGAC